MHWTVTESVDYTLGQVPYSGITGAQKQILGFFLEGVREAVGFVILFCFVWAFLFGFPFPPFERENKHKLG